MSDSDEDLSPNSPNSPNAAEESEQQQQQKSRKERKRKERELKAQKELDELSKIADQVNTTNDSPFSVTLEQDAVAEGSRNISFNKVSVTVNGKILFQDTAVRLSAGCRYGLMGPNGRGKSTLLRLLSARELPVQKSLDVLLVEQEQELQAGDVSAVQAVIQSHKLQIAYIQEAEALRAKRELKEAEMARLQFLEEELIVMGASLAEARARKILFGLGFPTDWHDRPTSSFSGGWRKRIALASAVYIEPDVLMLDEPTNHLDLNAVIWLETYLSKQYSTEQKRPKTLVVVSHDAGFLDGICTHMVHIEFCKLHYYRGGFSAFQSQVETHHQEMDKRHAAIQKQISEKKKHGTTNDQIDDWLAEQVRQGKIDQDFIQKRREYSVTFPFPQPPELRDACVIKLDDVKFKYPGAECPILFEKVSCALWNDSRITLCGPNGIGKSTLLNLMTGLLEPIEGHITINRTVRIGRYNQHFVDKLPLERTATDYIQSLGIPEEHEARRLLGSFGLEGICHKNMIATLSGGQKARVALAAISAEKPHFLLLDEPTNHLDVESIEALCTAVNNFRGGVLVVTHDARLIKDTNMQLWIAGDKNVKPFNGTLDDYKEHVRKIFEDEEAQKERDRQLKKIEKKEEKAGITQEEKEKKTEEFLQKQAEVMDDFFAKGKPKPKKKKAPGEEENNKPEDAKKKKVKKPAGTSAE